MPLGEGSSRPSSFTTSKTGLFSQKNAGLRAETMIRSNRSRQVVPPSRNGDERQPLAGVPLVQQRQRQLGIQLYEPVGVRYDLGLQLPLHVGLVDGGAHHAVEIGVAQHPFDPSRVQQVHQLRVHARFGDGEERVEEDELGGAQAHQLPGVHRALLLERQLPGTVVGPFHVAEPVCLEDIAVLQVEDQAPDDEVRVELQVVNGPSQCQELLLQMLVGPPLPLLHPIVDEGVVHVVADGPDGPQVEGAVAEDTPLPGGRGGLGSRGDRLDGAHASASGGGAGAK
jgi:hypothetical protein